MLHATPLFSALAAPPHPSPRLSPTHSEFASLEAWLCSDPVRQLPLYEVESQQYPKGRELQRCSSKLTSNSAASVMWDPPWRSSKPVNPRSTPFAASTPAGSKPSLGRFR